MFFDWFTWETRHNSTDIIKDALKQSLRNDGVLSYISPPPRTKVTGDSVYRSLTTDKELTVKIDVPGVELSNIDVSVGDRSLTIGWRRDDDSNRSSLRLSIHHDFDVEKVTAQLKLGVLTLIIPRIESTTTQKQKKVVIST